MTQSPSSIPAAAPMSLIQRAVGVLFSPKATFASVVSYPRWLGAALLGIFLALGSQYVFTSTEVGRQAVLDQQLEMVGRFTRVTPEMEAQSRAALESPVRRAVNQVFGLVGILLVIVILSAALFGVFAATGGTASFKQVLAVTAHAGLIFGVTSVLVLPLWFMKQSMSSVTNLAVAWPGDEYSFIARLLGMIDLIWVWWLFVLAVGLAVLYRRRTQSIFVSLLGVYVVVAALIAGVMSAVGGS